MQTFLGMYSFQFTGHVLHYPDEKYHVNGHGLRCTGVLLYYSVTPAIWEKPIYVYMEDNDGK